MVCLVLKVMSVEPPSKPLQGGEVCSHTSDAVVPALGVDAPGAPSKEKQGIREVQISFKLMDDFLRCAWSQDFLYALSILGFLYAVWPVLDSPTSVLFPVVMAVELQTSYSYFHRVLAFFHMV